MFHLLKKIDSVILVSGMSKVWEDTNRCAKQYMCDLAIYVMTMLSYSYDITIDCVINSPVHGKNAVGGINETEKTYLKGEMKLIGKLGSNYTTKIGILPSALKYFSVKFADQCLHIPNNKDKLNGLKGSTKMQKNESLFEYQSRIHNYV